MEISPELIKKFFSRNCTAAEADFVAEFLKQHPEYLEEHFSEAEFESTVSTEQDDYTGDWEAWEALQKSLRKNRVIKMMQRLAVAASVAAIAFIGIRSYYHQSLKQIPATQELAASTIASDGTEEIVNASDTVMLLSLADGTKVRLAAGSTLRFNDSTWKTRRDIELAGEANFYVAKDKMRPFTVYCNQVATTALGTIFSVRQNTGGDSLRVRLFEGKVRVRKMRYQPGVDSTDLMKPYILAAGQEILFAPGKDLAVLRDFMPKALPKYIARDKAINETHSLPANTWVEFNNQPLSDLFVSLEVLYNVQINYSRRDIRNLSFIGRFEPYDNIDEILEIIAKLNGLAVQKTAANQYKVSKTTR